MDDCRVSYLRYLPLGETGEGTIIACLAAEGAMTLDRWRKLHPEHFAERGFYHVLEGTNERASV